VAASNTSAVCFYLIDMFHDPTYYYRHRLIFEETAKVKYYL